MSKWLKRVMSISVCLILGLSPILVRQITVGAEDRLEGSGTAADPYLIYTVHDLRMIDTHLREEMTEPEQSNYRLMNDLDLSSYGNWPAIGGVDYVFEGHFDGQGYQISGLQFVDAEAGANIYGLFGLSMGTIENLELLDCRFELTHEPVLANDYLVLGAAVAYNFGKIRNVFVSGEITVVGRNDEQLAYGIGGVCGHNEGVLRQVQNAANLRFETEFKQTDYPARLALGGVTGVNDIDGEIDRATNSGSVAHNHGISYVNAAGGIVGRSRGQLILVANFGRIKVDGTEASAGGIIGTADRTSVMNAYNFGSVEGTFAGGIIGTGLHANVRRAYDAGELTAERAAGAIIGAAFYLPVSITESFYADPEGKALGIDLYKKEVLTLEAVALTDEQFKDSSLFENWDFGWDWALPPAGAPGAATGP